MKALKYEMDELNAAVLVDDRGQQVMMEWEREYMEKLVEMLEIKNSDMVLEIGFGLGFSANCIQKYCPRKHYIVECDERVLKELYAWAEEKANVYVVAGTWQREYHRLPDFDCVFFDDYPLPEDNEDVLAQEMYASRWDVFLDRILNGHVKVNGRITGYLARDIDLKRVHCSTVVKEMQVKVPRNCRYYDGNRAYLPKIVYCPKGVEDETCTGVVSEKLQQLERKVMNGYYGINVHENNSTESRRERIWRIRKLKQQQNLVS